MKTKAGIFWMIVAALLFATMAACIKVATRTVTVPQAVFFRMLVMFPIILVWAKLSGVSLRGKRTDLLVARSIFGLVALTLTFYAISNIPLGNVAILITTWPIFIALLAYPITGEKVSPRILILLPFFVAGVALIVKPDGTFVLLPSLAALASGLLIALARLFVRTLGRTEHALTIVFYFAVIGILGSVGPALFLWNPVTQSALLFLISAGILATLAQLAMTRAYQLEEAGPVSVYGYSAPIFAFIHGITFFGEKPDLAALAGTMLIIACGYAATRIKTGE